MSSYNLHQRAAAIIKDAGGQLVGRTRLQKVAYLAQLAGFAHDFSFEYRHYGPYSEDLAEAMEIATGLAMIKEEERRADWGGWYSIYSVDQDYPANADVDAARENFISSASKIGAIELELAATAAFLFAEEGYGDPWTETANRKPGKADHLPRAKEAYKLLLGMKTPIQLPQIV
jgi:hypothetical protein